MATIANRRDVREKLNERGLIIPETTQFVGVLHDTSRDEFTYYDLANVSPAHLQIIEDHKKQFERVLECIVLSPEDEVGSYEVMSEEERYRILVEWNETRVEYPKDKTIQDLFEEQVERSPESIAVVYGDMQLTYQELNERANQLAHYLRKKGVGRETLVGLSLNRSIEMVIGILGIIKAGGAYVPLDPEYPEERLQYMLEDTGALVLITSERLKEKFRGYKGDFVLLDDEDVRKELQNSLKENSVRVSGGNDLVYVIYTSGSTGLPKGGGEGHRSGSCG